MCRAFVVGFFISILLFEHIYCHPDCPSGGPPPPENHPGGTPPPPPPPPENHPGGSPPPDNHPGGTPPDNGHGGGSGNQPEHGGGGGGGGGGCSGDKPEVVISFDSMNCPSITFFRNQLKPIFEEMSKCVKWHFIPCSTSKIVKDVLQCCGGVEACQINVLHACAAHYYEDDEEKLGKFFICMMTDDNQYVKGEACAKEAGMDWKRLNDCQPKEEAGTFCDNRYKQLNALKEPKIPGVLYNMHYDCEAEKESLDCLKTGICNQIKKQGGQCAACGSSGSGGGSSGGGSPGSGSPGSASPGSASPGSGSPGSGSPGGSGSGGSGGGHPGGSGGSGPPPSSPSPPCPP